MNNLIDERNERTRRRKKIKRKMDSIIGLSYNGEVDKEKNAMSLSMNIAKLADKTIRLLDEGYFDSGFVIKKGTLEKFLNGENQYVRGWEMTDNGWEPTPVLNLTDDFVGTVNIGHMDFATFPFIVGEWNKADLSVVNIGNDRVGIDVALRLDKKSVFVKELARQPYDIGISSEFWYHINQEDTEALSETLGIYTPVIDEVFIFAYGLVGECGNVNSSGLELKGDSMAKIEKVDIQLNLENAEEIKAQIEDIKESLDEVNEEAKELGIEELDITVNDEDELEPEDAAEEDSGAAEEELAELSAEDAEDEAEAEDEESDEEGVVEEDGEDEADEEDEAEEVEDLSEALSLIKSLKAENAGLKDIIAELKKRNRRANKKLAAEKDAKAKFLEATKELSIELLPNEAEVEKQKAEEQKEASARADYVRNGGVADI